MDALKRIPNWPAALLLAFLFLVGCSEQKQTEIITYSGMTMGTTFTIKWVDKPDAEIQKIQSDITLSLKEVNQIMSTYIKDSELSLFNQLPAGSSVTVSDALRYVLSMSQSISERSAGSFDVTVGPLVNLWGFGPDGRVIKAPSDDEIAKQRRRVGYHQLIINAENKTITKQAALYVDLSAIAKGYGVDVVASVLEKYGIKDYLVEIGGELRASGLKPNQSEWRIAIESPVSGERAVEKIISISNTGIATSGDYRNYFEENGIRYSHTIDPATGKPIAHKLASVTVLRPTCAEADGLATAFMVMGEERAYDFAVKNKIDAFFIVKSNQGFQEYMTPGFEQRLVK